MKGHGAYRTKAVIAAFIILSAAAAATTSAVDGGHGGSHIVASCSTGVGWQCIIRS